MSAAPSLPKTQSVARRLTLLAMGLLVAVLVLVSTLIAVVAESRTRDRLVEITGDKVQSIADTVDAMDITARQLTERAYKPFRAQFPARWRSTPPTTPC